MTNPNRALLLALAVLLLAAPAAAREYGLADVKGSFAFTVVGDHDLLFHGDCVPPLGVLVFDGEGGVTGYQETIGSVAVLPTRTVELKNGDSIPYRDYHDEPFEQTLAGTYEVHPSGIVRVSFTEDPPAVASMAGQFDINLKVARYGSELRVTREADELGLILADQGRLLRGHRTWKAHVWEKWLVEAGVSKGPTQEREWDQTFTLRIEAVRQEAPSLDVVRRALKAPEGR